MYNANLERTRMKWECRHHARFVQAAPMHPHRGPPLASPAPLERFRMMQISPLASPAPLECIRMMQRSPLARSVMLERIVTLRPLLRAQRLGFLRYSSSYSVTSTSKGNGTLLSSTVATVGPSINTRLRGSHPLANSPQHRARPPFVLAT